MDSDLEDLDTESEEGADGVKDYDPDEDSAFVEDEEESDADSDTEIDPFPDLWGERKESYDNPGVTALNIDAIDKGTPNKNASNKDMPGKDVSGSVITPNNDKTEGKTNTLSPEEERAIRNKKSILGMTVVRPSTNRTVISNPLVDPISAKPKVETTDSAPTADETPSGSGQFLANAQISGHREIKSANIISQKKRDE